MRIKKIFMKTQLIFSNNNPIVANHRVGGRMILPGMAYIDLIIQFCRKKAVDSDALEIRNLTILNPLIVEENTKVIVSISDTEVAQGHWKIKIEGRKAYVHAEVVRSDVYPMNGAVDIGSFKKNAQESFPIGEVYKRYAMRGLLHTGVMKAEGLVYKSDQGILFEGSPALEAMPTADQFLFHPALVDGSAIAIMPLFNELVNEGEHLFLPVYVGSFRSLVRINRRCFSYMPFSSVKRKGEVTSFDIYFLDEYGHKTGEILNLTSKLVREGAGVGEVGPVPSRMPITSTDEDRGAVFFLRNLVASYLNMDPLSIDVNLPYYNLGFDSMSLLQLAEVISAKIDVELPPTLLFEHGSIQLLADHLRETYTEKLQ
jgi:polyketide synthase PksM